MTLFPEVDREIRDIKKQAADKLEQFRKIAERYRPSNGTEGMIFEDNVCGDCAKYEACEILFRLQCGNYHKDLIIKDGKVICFQHPSFNMIEFAKSI